MVWIFSPPGVSSALANNRRASVSVTRLGGLPSIAAIRSESSLSGSTAHSASRAKTRLDISEAAALV